MATNVTKLNALRRLTMRAHTERPAPCKHKEYTIRIYDGDHVVGYVGLYDLIEAEKDFGKLIDASEPLAQKTALQTIANALEAILKATLNLKTTKDAKADLQAIRDLAVNAFADVHIAIEEDRRASMVERVAANTNTQES